MFDQADSSSSLPFVRLPRDFDYSILIESRRRNDASDLNTFVCQPVISLILALATVPYRTLQH
jgi:hypothetical protein